MTAFRIRDDRLREIAEFGGFIRRGLDAGQGGGFVFYDF